MGPFSGDFGDGLQSINPDDIETMTVLKGASAAALYGFRAKDGVIIMTTKAGGDKKGIGIELISSFTANRAIDALDDYQYEYGQGEGGLRPTSVTDARSSGTWSFGTRFDGQPVWCIDGLEHPYVPFKDRINAAYQTGTVSNTTLALSGGNQNGNIRLSITNTDSKNIIPNSSFNKKILSLGSNFKFSEKLSAQLNGNYSIENNINPFASSGYSSFTCAVLEAANSIDPRWTKNNYKDPVTGDEIPWTRAVDHPNWDWIVNERGAQRKQDRIFGNVLLRYDLAPWLYLQGRIGQDFFTADTWSKIPTGALNLPPATVGYNGGYSQGTNSFREINADFMVGANKKFGDFGTNLTLGGNAMQQINKGLSVSVTNFYVRDLYDIANGQIKVPKYTYSEKKVNSLYGSMDLSFKDYLFLTLTLRNDWFSTLNPLSNSYLYPSLSSSFLFSQALPSLMPSWLTYGKLRASYAEVGGDTDPYSNALYYFVQTNNFGNYPYGAISGNVSPNANLRPLKVKETEVGLELIFFDRLISIDVAAYIKNTVDEILNVDISRSSGYSGTKVNVGKLRNQGIESLLTLVPVRTQNFNWQIGLNYTYNESEVLQLAGGQTRINVGSGTWIGRVSQEVGMPMGSIRGTDYLRDDQGRIITNQGRFQAGKEITFGSGLPPHMGGFLNTFTYKGVRVFTQIDFKAGKDFVIISHTAYDGYRKGHVKATLVGRREGENGVVFEGVNIDGTPNTTAVECQTFYTDYASKKVSTPLVYNASFVRWRTLSVGYDFSKLLSNTSIRGLTLNANINNVLVFISHIPNLDPECVSTVSDTRMGIEEVAAPATRDYSISLNIKF
jgi:TonB-linked SusC/RagA family outer membrane protein